MLEWRQPQALNSDSDIFLWKDIVHNPIFWKNPNSYNQLFTNNFVTDDISEPDICKVWAETKRVLSSTSGYIFDRWDPITSETKCSGSKPQIRTVRIENKKNFIDILKSCQGREGRDLKIREKRIIKNEQWKCYYCSACDRTFNTFVSFDVHTLHVSRSSNRRLVGQTRLKSIADKCLVPPCDECFQYFCDKTPTVLPNFGIWVKVHSRKAVFLKASKSKDSVLEGEVLMCPVCYTFLRNRSIKEILVEQFWLNNSADLQEEEDCDDVKPSFNNIDEDTNSETDSSFKICHDILDDIIGKSSGLSVPETVFLTDLQEVCRFGTNGFLQHCKENHSRTNLSIDHLDNLDNLDNLLRTRRALGTNPIGLPTPVLIFRGRNPECWLTPEETQILEDTSPDYLLQTDYTYQDPVIADTERDQEQLAHSAIVFNTDYPGLEFLVATYKSSDVTTSTTRISTHNSYFNTTPISTNRNIVVTTPVQGSAKRRKLQTQAPALLAPQDPVADDVERCRLDDCSICALPAPQDPAADYLPPPVFELECQSRVGPDPFVLNHKGPQSVSPGSLFSDRKVVPNCCRWRDQALVFGRHKSESLTRHSDTCLFSGDPFEREEIPGYSLFVVNEKNSVWRSGVTCIGKHQSWINSFTPPSSCIW